MEIENILMTLIIAVTVLILVAVVVLGISVVVLLRQRKKLNITNDETEDEIEEPEQDNSPTESTTQVALDSNSQPEGKVTSFDFVQKANGKFRISLNGMKQRDINGNLVDVTVTMDDQEMNFKEKMGHVDVPEEQQFTVDFSNKDVVLSGND